MRTAILLSILLFGVSSFAKSPGGPIMGYVAADDPYNGDQFIISCQDRHGNITQMDADDRATSSYAQRFDNPNYTLTVGEMACTLKDLTKTQEWLIPFEIGFNKSSNWIQHTALGNFLVIRVWVSNDQKIVKVFGTNFNRQ